jgi:hypothetical protein
MVSKSIDEAVKDLLTDQKEVNYVITTDDPTFNELGLSTFTSGQLLQFLYADSAAKSYQGAGTLQIPIPGGEAGDTFRHAGDGGSFPEEIVEHILKANGHNHFTAGPIGADQTAEFIRFDVLTKLDVLEQWGYSTSEWDRERYPGCDYVEFGRMIPIPDELGGGSLPEYSASYPIQIVVAVNQLSVEGKLEVNLGDDSEEAKEKVGRQNLLNDIRTSMSGCVSWKQSMAFNFGGECSPSGLVNFKLFVFDKSLQRNPDRRIALRGSPLIVGVPTTAHGVTFAGGLPTTDGAKGSYPPVQFGGDTNPNNTITGELETSYNPNTGKFEAGTRQILARLLTDVEGVALNKIGGGGHADTLTEGMLSPTGNYALGNFTVGEAMPMGVHNGNPYDFGPFFVGKACEKDKKHKIRVVNRAPKSFPVGQIVLCSKIDNEWIIQDFGYQDTDPHFFDAGNWRFCTMIANKDAYFKDERHTYDAIDGDTFGGTLTEVKYEYAFRWQYWMSIALGVAPKPHQSPFQPVIAYWPVASGHGTTHEGVDNQIEMKRNLWDEANMVNTAVDVVNWDILELNGITKMDAASSNLTFKENPNVFGSRRYHQVSSFDFMNAGGGGFRDRSLIGRCNPLLDLNNEVPVDPAEQDAQEFFPMFGPIFPDGFDKTQVAAAESLPLVKRGMNPIFYTPAEADTALINFSDVDPGDPGFISDPQVALGLMPIDGGANRGMFRADDINASQLPADVGHNAKPYADDGAPLEDQNMMLQFCNVVTNRVYGAQLDEFGKETGEVAEIGVRGGAPDLLWHGTSIMMSHVAGSINWGEGSWASEKAKHKGRQQPRWQWFARGMDDGSPPTQELNQSAWGLKPNNPRRIAFMPLNLEHLTSFDYTIGTGMYYAKAQGVASSKACELIQVTSVTPHPEVLRSHLNSLQHYQNNGEGQFPNKECGPFSGKGQFDFAYNRLGTISPDNFCLHPLASAPNGMFDHHEFLWPVRSLYRNYVNRQSWEEGSPPVDPKGNTRGHDYCTLASNYPMRPMDFPEGAYQEFMHWVGGGLRQEFVDSITTCCDCPNNESGDPHPDCGDCIEDDHTCGDGAGPDGGMCIHGQPMKEDFTMDNSAMLVHDAIPCRYLCEETYGRIPMNYDHGCEVRVEMTDEEFMKKQPEPEGDGTYDSATMCTNCCDYPDRSSDAIPPPTKQTCRPQSLAEIALWGFEETCWRVGGMTNEEREAYEACANEVNASVEECEHAARNCGMAGVAINDDGCSGPCAPSQEVLDAAAEHAYMDVLEPSKTIHRGFPFGVYVRDQHEYGNYPIDAHPDGTEGMETVGIITGKTTIRVGGFEVGIASNSYTGLPRVESTSAALSQAYGNWGVKSDSISSMATTATFAKMYDAWPDEQTIFDPRYFAVMHFNEGQLGTIPSGEIRGVSSDPSGEQPFMWVDALSTAVDHRVPVLYGEVAGDTPDLDPPEPENGFEVFSYSEDSEEPLEDRIRPDIADWKVATHRRGQLLPYSYFRKTVGLAYDRNAYHMAVPGKGYKIGDLFKVVGGQGAGAKVVVCEVEDDGAIRRFSLGTNSRTLMFNDTRTDPDPDPGWPSNYPRGFNQYLDKGRDFGPTDFVTIEEYEAITDDEEATLVLKAPSLMLKTIDRLDGGATTGVGAVIYVLWGEVYSYQQDDLGPNKQCPTTRVSASSNNGLNGSLDGREYTVRLPIFDPNEEGYYDIFTHFHNEISHTTSDSYDTRYTLGRQQFVTLELRGM